MAKPKVFVARKMAQEALDKIAEVADVDLWQDDAPTPREVLMAKVKDIDGLLSLLTEKVDVELMDIAPKLKVVSNLAVGFDNINIPEATKRGILVGNTAEVLTESTRHMIGAAEFAKMKPTAVFVNSSRGPVVDQKALYEALKSGQIFAAGLDVTEVEPIPMDDPLLTLDNIIIAPHIASGSVATRTKMANLAAANLIAGLKGEMPPSCVNPEVLKKRG